MRIVNLPLANTQQSGLPVHGKQNYQALHFFFATTCRHFEYAGYVSGPRLQNNGNLFKVYNNVCITLDDYVKCKGYSAGEA